MTAVWIRALLYLLLVGVGWLVILPAGLLLLERGSAWPLWNGLAFTAVGGALCTVGFGLASWAGYCLIQIGHGTPLPLAGRAVWSPVARTTGCETLRRSP